MIPPPEDESSILCRQNLQPSTLGTCRLLYQECYDVLYGENVFDAHHTDKTNPNAVSIRSTGYSVDLHMREHGKDDTKIHTELLSFQKMLRPIELDIALHDTEDPDIFIFVRQVLQNHHHLEEIKVISSFPWGFGYGHTPRLERVVREEADLLGWPRIPQNFWS
jgi:hypothetical protein